MHNLNSTARLPMLGANMWDLLFSKVGLIAISAIALFIASPTFRCVVLAILFGDLFFGDDCE